ncbi:beta-lactamase class A [Mariprofundus ferrinatatus]|uniref:beta-lactamase n=1 Tax=Mariprofundus ferrinatatus TaxID=1921087 RepID=A0A2K8L4Q1_9PROT|nr:serine hydrolase [Mariprofundus ferrinatatus]ATX82305.1 beta-lactamase class A [Mariprofundus ferrinatatus]
MARKSRMAVKLWFRLMTGLLFFMLVPHKSVAVDSSHHQTRHHKTTTLKKTHPTVRDHASPKMQRMLEKRIASLHLSRAIHDKRLSVALVDVTDPSAPAMAQINGDEMMYAASLPKIAILLAAFERISEGKLPLDDELRKTMTDMIRHSSNTAATEMIRKVGGDYINKVLASPKYRLYDPNHNGGLWVGKEYAGSKAFHRDPLHQLSHGATALQTARYYYLLETGQLVSPKHSREMKTILSKPGISHKFVKGLEDSPHGNLEMYRKSGTWRSYHADSALIEHDGRRYIAVALARDPKGGEWMKKLIREMDEIIVDLHEQDEVFATAGAHESLASAAHPRSSSSKRLM